MNSIMSIEAPAKLNLNLFITGKHSQGLHLLHSHVCFLELSDKISINYSLRDIFIQTSRNSSFLINSYENLILKTINAFRSYTNWKKKFKITLDKQIPIGAGLGGGSADAAALLILLRTLYNKEKNIKAKIKKSSLFEIAIQL